MARIRTIKPEFWTDEKVVELSAFARLLFIGIWNFCDDDGRLVYSPKRLKMQIFPADDIDCAKLVGELEKQNLVMVYEVDGEKFLQVNGFAKHQKIDKRSASKLPIPPNPAESPRISPNPADGREKEKDQGKERKELKTLVEQTALDVGVDPVREVFEFWQKVMQSPRAKLDKAREKAIRNALKQYPIEDIRAAIQGCAKSAYHMGANSQRTKYNEPELIFRNAANFERFLACNANGGAPSGLESVDQRNARVAAEFLGDDGMTLEMVA